MSRFDYVRYDERSNVLQARFKKLFEEIESVVDVNLSSSRAKALVLTNLEQSYMWIGKGIRDDQIIRDELTQLQESRKNG